MWMKRGTNDVEYKKTGYTVACDWAGAVMPKSYKKGIKQKCYQPTDRPTD